MDGDCRKIEYRLSATLVGSIAILAISVLAAWVTYAYETTSFVDRNSNTASAVLEMPRTLDVPQLSAKAAAVIDENGSVLYNQNSEVQLPLASLTKVALVLSVAKKVPLDAIITLDRDVSGNGSGDTLPKGSSWYTRDLMAFTLVASSNDAAEVLSKEAERARNPASTQTHSTVDDMNLFAQAIGMKRTYFINPSGLDESETVAGGYGSAGDVARMMLHASRQYPELFNVTARHELTIRSTAGLVARAKNTDDAVGEIPYFLAGKTGLTDLAGGNLAVVVESRGHRYAVVVLGSTEGGRFTDVKTLSNALQSRD